MSLAQFHSYFTLLSLHVIGVTLEHALEQNGNFTSLCKTRDMLLSQAIYPQNAQTELFWEGWASARIIHIFLKKWYLGIHMTNFTEDEESLRESPVLSTPAFEFWRQTWTSGLYIQTTSEKIPEEKSKLKKQPNNQTTKQKTLVIIELSSCSKNVNMGGFAGLISLHWGFLYFLTLKHLTLHLKYRIHAVDHKRKAYWFVKNHNEHRHILPSRLSNGTCSISHTPSFHFQITLVKKCNVYTG